MAALAGATSIHVQNVSQGFLMGVLAGKMKRVLGHEMLVDLVLLEAFRSERQPRGSGGISDGAKAPSTTTLIVEADRFPAGFFASSVVESVLQNAATQEMSEPYTHFCFLFAKKESPTFLSQPSC